MGTWNLGSVADQVYNSIDEIPTTISGLLPTISMMAMTRVEIFTGQTIGSNSITERYQPPIFSFAMSDTLMRMSIQGPDVSSVSLGDWSYDEGGESNSEKMAEMYEKQGMKQMQSLGLGTRWNRTYGGNG
jgi:hypothetical protein